VSYWIFNFCWSDRVLFDGIERLLSTQSGRSIGRKAVVSPLLLQQNFAAISAKSEAIGCSITVDFWEKGFYPSLYLLSIINLKFFYIWMIKQCIGCQDLCFVLSICSNEGNAINVLLSLGSDYTESDFYQIDIGCPRSFNDIQ